MAGGIGDGEVVCRLTKGYALRKMLRIRNIFSLVKVRFAKLGFPRSHHRFFEAKCDESSGPCLLLN
jgi:hypothetical protein